MSESNRTTLGLIWAYFDQMLSTMLNFLIKFILIRHLYPDDFGLVAICMIAVSIAEVVNGFGFKNAIIQRVDAEHDTSLLATIFWTAVGIGLTSYLLFVLLVTPLMIHIYDIEFMRDLLPILAIGLLFSPLTLIQSSLLTKKLDFKTLTIKANIARLLAGAMAISMAFLDYGIWSLVTNIVLTKLLVAILLYRATTWRPIISWKKSKLDKILSFSSYNFGSQITNKILSNIDYIIISKILGTYALGLYSVAFILTDTFRKQLTGVINKVIYPVYAQHQNDLDKITSIYLKTVKFNSILIYPIMFFLIYFAETIVNFIFGAQWSDAVPIIQIIASSVLVHLVVSSNTAIIRASGHAKLEFKLQIIKTVFIFIPCILLGTIYFDIVGASLGYLAAKTIAVIISLVVLKRLFNLSILKSLAQIYTTVLCCMFSLMVAHATLWLNFHVLLAMIMYGFSLLIGYVITLRPEIEELKARFNGIKNTS